VAVYIVTGELGSGKSLQAVNKIREALQGGRRVATNMNIRVERLVSSRKRFELYRLPDWPTLADLVALGKGHEGKFDEKKFGLIVLDELATFMNSREWQGEGKDGKKIRLDLINWFRHARKLRWHLILLSQDIESLDKQVRAALAEHVVRCKRLDRFTVPLLSTLTKMLGFGAVSLPQVHLGIVRYGSHLNAPVVDKWWLPDAKSLHGAYDTEQKILGEESAATMLDGRSAPYLWEPQGVYELLWKAGFWRWLPESTARARYNDARLADLGAAPSCKRNVSFQAWCQARAGHPGPLGAEGGEAAGPERAEPLPEAA